MSNPNAKIILPRSGLGKDMIANGGSPMSFTASVTGLTPGMTQVFDSAALQPGYRVPYVIDAITMMVKSPADLHQGIAGTTVVPDCTGFGGLVDFLFQTGHHAFSAKPIAAPAFCPRYAFWSDVQYQQVLSKSVPVLQSSVYQTMEELAQQTGSVVLIDANTYPTVQVYCVYKWLLPRPLLLLPGDVINASCVRNASLAAGTSPTYDTPFGTMAATVTYTGRALPPGTKLPTSHFVPWVGMFDSVEVDAAGPTWANSNREFENPFQRDWNIQRLVARNVYAYNANSSGASTVTIARDSGASVKITDPLGYQITNGFVPIAVIANGNDQAAWTFSRPVGPRQRVNMEFNLVPRASPGAGSRNMVSLIGYREEDL